MGVQACIKYGGRIQGGESSNRQGRQGRQERLAGQGVKLMPFLGTEERRSRMGMDRPAQGQGQGMTVFSLDFPLIFPRWGDGPIWGITLTRTPAFVSRLSSSA